MAGLYKWFEPEWSNEIPEDGSFRSVFKWGKLEENLTFSEGFYMLLKDKLGLSDSDFVGDKKGFELIEKRKPCRLAKTIVDEANKIFSKERVSSKVFDRVSASYGKSLNQIVELREGKIGDIADLVVYPINEAEIEALFEMCVRLGVKIAVAGSQISKVEPFDFSAPCIMVQMEKYYNKVIRFNEFDNTITVQTGLVGWKLEKILNQAPENFDVDRRYSCGYFAPEFDFATVGGWISGRSCGTSNYTDISDVVVSQTYITPSGRVELTADSKRGGVNVGDLFIGAEGSFGILSEATIKFQRYYDARVGFCFMFKNMEYAQQALKDIMQSNNPCQIELFDPNATRIKFASCSSYRKLMTPYFKMRGKNSQNSCLIIGFVPTSKIKSGMLESIKANARKNKGMTLFGFSASLLLKENIDNPYFKDTLMDFGVFSDNLKCLLNYNNLNYVYNVVDCYLKMYPKLLYSISFGHCHSDSAVMNIRYVSKMSLRELDEFREGLCELINESGGGLCVNNGIGKKFLKYLAQDLSKDEIMRTMKNHFDPNGIMANGAYSLPCDRDNKVAQRELPKMKNGVYVLNNGAKRKNGKIEIISKTDNRKVAIAELNTESSKFIKNELTSQKNLKSLERINKTYKKQSKQIKNGKNKIVKVQKTDDKKSD